MKFGDSEESSDKNEYLPEIFDKTFVHSSLSSFRDPTSPGFWQTPGPERGSVPGRVHRYVTG